MTNNTDINDIRQRAEKYEIVSSRRMFVKQERKEDELRTLNAPEDRKMLIAELDRLAQKPFETGAMETHLLNLIDQQNLKIEQLQMQLHEAVKHNEHLKHQIALQSRTIASKLDNDDSKALFKLRRDYKQLSDQFDQIQQVKDSDLWIEIARAALEANNSQINLAHSFGYSSDGLLTKEALALAEAIAKESK